MISREVRPDPASGGGPRPARGLVSFLDPVTLKEIFGISRRGQTYFGRVVYVGLTGLIVWQFWWNLVSTTPFFNVSASAELGRDLFRRFLPMQMLLVSLA